MAGEMIAGILKETLPGERRVAVVPANVPALKKLGLDVLLEPGAGADAGFPDADYVKQGATLGTSHTDVALKADLLLQVRTPGANGAHGPDDGVPGIVLFAQKADDEQAGQKASSSQ